MPFLIVRRTPTLSTELTAQDVYLMHAASALAANTARRRSPGPTDAVDLSLCSRGSVPSLHYAALHRPRHTVGVNLAWLHRHRLVALALLILQGAWAPPDASDTPSMDTRSAPAASSRRRPTSRSVTRLCAETARKRRRARRRKHCDAPLYRLAVSRPRMRLLPALPSTPPPFWPLSAGSHRSGGRAARLIDAGLRSS